MSKIPTIRIKSTNPARHNGFFIRNADDLRYGEELFKAEEFESLGEHEIRLMLESSPIDEFFEAEATLWLELKSKEFEKSETSARSAREIETLSVAKEANRLASEANAIARSQTKAAWRAARYAMYAAIIATIAAIVANKDDIFTLIFKYLI